MTTIADLSANADALTTVSYPVIEPLNSQEIFGNKLHRFGANYNVSNESHLYRFLVALCGDRGAGQLKKEMLLPRLEQQLEATHFGNLDKLYGNPLGLPRLNSELYTYDPDGDILNRIQWDEVRAKDASYRARCLIWMRAILNGPTKLGIALAAEAATGIEADVWERYQYVQNPTSTDFGKTTGINEFVVIPRTPTLTPANTRQISRLLDQIKPVNTIGTIATGSAARGSRTARLSAASSNFFNINRFVTGRPDVVWPAINVSNGMWIDTSEREAPTYAFMNRQESVTYLSIVGVQASSSHQGYFNNAQQQLFSHLRAVNDPYTMFTADFSYDTSIAPVNLQIEWTGGGSAGDNVVVNNSYPLGYFANIDSTFTANNSPSQHFWSSVEKTFTSTLTDPLRFNEFAWGDGSHFGMTVELSNNEWIEYDFGRSRPLNYVHFEICCKPIDWRIQYFNGTIWQDIPLKDEYPVTMSSTYLPSDANPWMDFDVYFNTVNATKVRFLFNRRGDSFPLPTSPEIAFSIDLRGVRLMHTIPMASDFVIDAGIDILGNAFRTAIVTYDSTKVTDGDTTTYWQSQPNPSRFAVEALYFDLRLGSVTGTMSYLDTQFMDELDTRSMADMETYYVNGQLIDEIYIDPITYGPDMHFYYSDDDTPEWDEKLWVPIPMSYTLKRGFHALPRPTYIRYFKVEFSNLTAIPYEPVQSPALPPVQFRRYPLWVNNYFNSFNNSTAQDVIQQTDIIAIDPLKFGFVKVDDSLISNFEAVRTLQVSSTDPEVASFIQSALDQLVDSTSQTQIEAQIQFRSPVMWQDDLIANLDATRALSRVAQKPRGGITDTGWSVELTLPVSDVPVQASSTDLAQPLTEKTQPTMWFPRRCRHQYQIVKAPLDKKIAYIVGVREVGFYRRTYTAPIDETIYIETLDDTAHIATNDFIQNDWRYVVPA